MYITPLLQLEKVKFNLMAVCTAGLIKGGRGNVRNNLALGELVSLGAFKEASFSKTCRYAHLAVHFLRPINFPAVWASVLML